MEGAIVLAVLIPLAIIVLMLVLLARMGALMRELAELRRQLKELLPTTRGDAVSPQRGTPTEPTRPAPVIEPVPAPAPKEPSFTPPPPVTPVAEDDTLRRMREAFPEPKTEPVPLVSGPGPKEPPAPPSRAFVPPPPRKTFFEKHPDLEKFIGENLINKIGIAVLVVGVGLLLKYAIGKGLISETGRTLIGLASGGLLVFLAHRLRASFRAFSSVLIAGGIAIFYFTVWIAFRDYQLIGQTAAFAIMAVITGLAVALAIAYDRKELAVISLLGGFAAPLLVSTGEGNYRVLFTYLLLLDAGMLVLANYKKWHVIHVLSLALTSLFMGAWAAWSYPVLEPPPALPAFGFATAFFLVFFAMNLRYNLRHKQAFTALDHALLLANTAAYYAFGICFLSDLHVRVNGLFTAVLGLYYLGFAVYFHRREGIPRPLKLLLTGLVLTFISLAAPVQLEGSRITLFWAAEAVLLLWFAQRTDLRLVECASVLVTALMLMSLWMDWQLAYGWANELPLRPLLNRAWIAGMASGVSLLLTHRLLRSGDGERTILMGLSRNAWRALTAIGAALTLYAVNMLEQQYQLSRVLHVSVVHQALMAFTLLYLLLMEWLTRRGHIGYRIAVGALLSLTGLVYLSLTYAASRSALSIGIANRVDLSFIPFHYLAAGLLVIGVVRLAMIARAVIDRSSSAWKLYLWIASAFLVVLASQELDLIMIQWHGSSFALPAARRVGYPILWGVGSFAFMWHGMRARLRVMRIIALTLFAITLLKLFLFDLGSLSEGGRVAAFIFLGALLLVISFMYQKLKGLFVDDHPTEPAPPDATQP